MTLPGITFSEIKNNVKPIEVQLVEGEPIESRLDQLVQQAFPPDKGRIKLWLLAQTYAGIVWGRMDEDGWHLSGDLGDEYPPLKIDSLLELRIFNPTGEILVWRDGAGLHGRFIADDEEVSLPHRDETQILWGTRGEPVGNQFTRMTDGDQKLLHAVPLAVPSAAEGPWWRPLRLKVRHYITRDEETGLARITLSRLVNLEVEHFNRREVGNGSQA